MDKMSLQEATESLEDYRRNYSNFEEEVAEAIDIVLHELKNKENAIVSWVDLYAEKDRRFNRLIDKLNADIQLCNLKVNSDYLPERNKENFKEIGKYAQGIKNFISKGE